MLCADSFYRRVSLQARVCHGQAGATDRTTGRVHDCTRRCADALFLGICFHLRRSHCERWCRLADVIPRDVVQRGEGQPAVYRSVRGRPSEQHCWIAADACCVEIHDSIIDWATQYGLHGMITRQTQKSYAHSCSIGAEEHEYKLNRNSVQDY